MGEQVLFIRGNNDRDVVTVFDDQPVIRCYLPALSERGLDEIRWIAGQLTHTERDLLASLPEQLVLHDDQEIHLMTTTPNAVL